MPDFRLSTCIRALIKAANPVFTSRKDRVAYAVHAYYLCHGYTLVGLGTADGNEGIPDNAQEIPMDGWNSSQELYVFKYKDESGRLLPVVVKCVGIGNILVICVSSVGPEDEEPRSLNLNVGDITTDSNDAIQGYASLEDLVDQFVMTLGQFPKEKKKPEEPSGGAHAQRQPQPSVVQQRRFTDIPRVGVTGGGYDFMPPELSGFGGVRSGGGGSLMGLNDPRFGPGLRHPELQPGHSGLRYDPIGPAGMRGYRPTDFQPGNQWDLGGPPVHPDVGPPGPGKGTDFDHMFG